MSAKITKPAPATERTESLEKLFKAESILTDARDLAESLENGRQSRFQDEALARFARLSIDEAMRLISEARHGLGDKRPGILEDDWDGDDGQPIALKPEVSHAD